MFSPDYRWGGMTIGRALFSFGGRLTRIWYWPLTLGIMVGFGAFLDLYIDDIFRESALIAALAATALWTYMACALAAKRLHDRDRSGWYLLIGAVPFIGWLFAIWFLVQAVLPGTKGDNRYGPDPRPAAVTPATGRDGAATEPEIVHRVEWIRGAELWAFIAGGLEDAFANVVGAILIVGIIGGFLVARNWADDHGTKLDGFGAYVTALRSAIHDDEYWAHWSDHFFHLRRAAAETPVPARADGAEPAPSATLTRAQLDALINEQSKRSDGPGNAAASAETAKGTAGAAADPADDRGEWNVGYETDPDSPISDRKILVAQLTHSNAAAPGHIDVEATCVDGAVAFEFDSFGPANKPADFDYSIGESDGNIFIVYRIDSGPQLLASNLLSGNHNYVNVVSVAFAQVGADYKPVLLDEIEAQIQTAAKDSDTVGKAFLNALTLNMSGLGALYGAMTPRDIAPFLRASRVPFQLPLKGGAKEVVAVAPHDPTFRDFLAKCGIAAGAP